jgi:hypothetical protein
VGLAQLLGDDIRGRVGVQKTIAQDLADDGLGAAVIGFGSGPLGLQGGKAALLEGVQELVITLTAKAVFGGEGGDVGVQALALHEQKETAGRFVGGINREGAGRAGELVRPRVEMKGCIHGG